MLQFWFHILLECLDLRPAGRNDVVMQTPQLSARSPGLLRAPPPSWEGFLWRLEQLSAWTVESRGTATAQRLSALLARQPEARDVPLGGDRRRPSNGSSMEEWKPTRIAIRVQLLLKTVTEIFDATDLSLSRAGLNPRKSC